MHRSTHMRQSGAAAGVQRDGFLRRQCACGAHTFGASICSACGKPKKTASASSVQAKLRIGAVADPLEAEADRVSEQVLAAPKPGTQGVQAAPPAIQRFSGGSAQETGQGGVPDSVEAVLAGRGAPLEAGLRQDMEGRFGRDFSGVRVHADGAAQRSAQDIDARAYTAGNHVVFGAGQLAPASHEGRRLIAHELTHVVQQHGGSIPATSVAAKPLVQRAPAVPELFPPLHLAADTADIEATDSAAATNPALARIAAAYKAQSAANPGANLTLTGYMNESARAGTSTESEERGRMRKRLNAVLAALETLGVPSSAVTVDAPTMFSSTHGGRVSVSLYKDKQSYSGLAGITPTPIGPAAPGKQPLPAAPPPGPPSNSPGLAELLSFKFRAGPVQFAVDLPKSVSAKLPVALGVAKSLSFELQAESSGDFSFSIALNRVHHVKVSAKAKLSVDKDKGSSGSAGLEIEATRTVCSAANPEGLKARITASGEKLKKAMTELETAKPDERLGKLVDIAGAIGDMYDAVDKSKAACKEVPAATFSFGVQGPLAPTTGTVNDPDPLKRPSTFIGGTLTIPF